MKIAYILYPEGIVINKANGIRNQAIAWKQAIADRAEVDLLSNWDAIDWGEYDVVHLFGGDQWLGFVPDLAALNPNIVFSPVLDTLVSQRKLKLQASLGFKGYHHAQNVYREYLRPFKSIFVRSEYEKSFYLNCYDCAEEKLQIVPITHDKLVYSKVEKEPFCLHISALYQPRKNVARLIEAAKKFNFNLVLGGSTGNEEQRRELINLIGNAPNIQLLGYLSTADMCELYSKAKVFALPSINEGVGIVALNAAEAGCEVVITNIGGPKEYFGKMAREVNPYCVDEIGQSVLDALNGPSTQPALQRYVKENYSFGAVGSKLFEAYNRVING